MQLCGYEFSHRVLKRIIESFTHDLFENIQEQNITPVCCSLGGETVDVLLRTTTDKVTFKM